MQTNVIAKIEIEGLHSWPEANDIEPEVGFLANVHRHKWFITAKKPVFHDDRDVEFIMFKRKINRYLREMYYTSELDLCDFGSQSCEMIAEELYKEFDLCYCAVYEDNENGAEVY